MVVTLFETATTVRLLALIALGVLVVSSCFGGWLVDRYGARRIAAVGCVVGAPPIAVLAAASGAGALSIPLIFALVAVAQLPDGAAGAAFEARLPISPTTPATASKPSMRSTTSPTGWPRSPAGLRQVP